MGFFKAQFGARRSEMAQDEPDPMDNSFSAEDGFSARERSIPQARWLRQPEEDLHAVEEMPGESGQTED